MKSEIQTWGMRKTTQATFLCTTRSDYRRHRQALHFACQAGHYDMVKLLLDNGAVTNSGSGDIYVSK